MMKGRNVLSVNHPTMVEAAQLWVNAQFHSDHVPKVVDVKFDGQRGMFDIMLQPQEDVNQLKLPLVSVMDPEVAEAM